METRFCLCDLDIFFDNYNKRFDILFYFRYNYFRIWRDKFMDDNKNMLNKDESQDSSNINYSFDFANQVENNTVNNEQNTQIQETQINNSTSTETVTSAEPMDVQKSTDSIETLDEVNVSDVSVDDSKQTVSDSETVSEIQEDSEELIKDKKETKRFLIILFVLLIAFIIALPFIFEIAG